MPGEPPANPTERSLGFPLTATIEKDLESIPHDLFSRLKVELGILGASDFRLSSDAIDFRVPLGRGTSGGPLFIVDRGRCRLDRNGNRAVLIIDLSFRRAVAITVAALTLWLLVSSVVTGWMGPVEVGALLVVGFLWLFGTWYLIVPRWLLRRLRLAPVGSGAH